MSFCCHWFLQIINVPWFIVEAVTFLTSCWGVTASMYIIIDKDKQKIWKTILLSYKKVQVNYPVMSEYLERVRNIWGYFAFWKFIFGSQGGLHQYVQGVYFKIWKTSVVPPEKFWQETLLKTMLSNFFFLTAYRRAQKFKCDIF